MCCCRYIRSQFSADDIDDMTLMQSASRLEEEENRTRDEPCELVGLCCPKERQQDPVMESNTQASNAQYGAVRNQGPVSDSSFTQLSQSTPGDEEPVILLTAPTGKAAHILGKKTGLPSYTLHQVTFSYIMWLKKRQQGVEWKYCHVRALVVDECSLVPISIFSWLLHALLGESNLQKLVLLGDVYQLPSIEPGNFLSDTYHSLQLIGCSVLLRTNHRSESRRIVENATLIAAKRDPVIEPEEHFYQITLPEREAGIRKEDDDLVIGKLCLHVDFV